MVPPSSTLSSSIDKKNRPSETNPLWESGWKESAPQQVASAYTEGDEAEGWDAWRRHLAARRHPRPVGDLFPGNKSPLLWSLPMGACERHVSALGVQDIDQALRRKKASPAEMAERLASWMAESTDVPVDVAYAHQCLVWCHGLVRLSALVAAEPWWELLGHLIETAKEAASHDGHNGPVELCLLGGELAVTLAYLLPELEPCAALATTGRHVLSRAVVELTDGEGFPNAENLPRLWPLLACWTRSQAIGSKLSEGCFDDEAHQQYQFLITHSLRCCRADGGSLFGEPTLGVDAMFESALEWGGDHADAEVACRILSGRSQEKSHHYEWPACSYESTWSEAAILRTAWSRKAVTLGVTYHEHQIHLEVADRIGPVLSGVWSLNVAIDGEPLAIDGASDWEQVAWESDDEVDYLELEMDIPSGLRVQRSLLLDRQNGFLLLADAVLGRGDHVLDYECTLPVAEGVTSATDDEAREVTLQTDKRRARILPLALPEWRRSPGTGSLETDESGVTLRQSGVTSLFAPVWIDLSPKALRREVTWRQLSVGQDRKNLPKHEAVGYRVQVGKRQWLIYRSLIAPSNRTVLGQNLTSEFHVSRFLRSGEVEELLEIE